MRFAICFTPLLLLAAAPAGASLTEIQWDKTGRFEQDLTLAPGKFAELCGPLKPGQAIAWSFKADAPLNFNIHYHEGERVQYPERQSGVAERSGSLRVDKDQGYCWMWSNKGSVAARLQVELQR